LSEEDSEDRKEQPQSVMGATAHNDTEQSNIDSGRNQAPQSKVFPAAKVGALESLTSKSPH
jgi:hypothetical protein